MMPTRLSISMLLALGVACSSDKKREPTAEKGGLESALGSEPALPGKAASLRLPIPDGELAKAVPDLQPAGSRSTMALPGDAGHVVFESPFQGFVRSAQITVDTKALGRSAEDILKAAWGDPTAEACWLSPTRKLRVSVHPSEDPDKPEISVIRFVGSVAGDALFQEALGKAGLGEKPLIGATAGEVAALAGTLGAELGDSGLLMINDVQLGCRRMPTLTLNVVDDKVVGFRASLPFRDDDPSFYEELEAALGKSTEHTEPEPGVERWVYAGEPRKVVVRIGRGWTLDVGSVPEVAVVR